MVRDPEPVSCQLGNVVRFYGMNAPLSISTLFANESDLIIEAAGEQGSAVHEACSVPLPAFHSDPPEPLPRNLPAALEVSDDNYLVYIGCTSHFTCW